MGREHLKNEKLRIHIFDSIFYSNFGVYHKCTPSASMDKLHLLYVEPHAQYMWIQFCSFGSR